MISGFITIRRKIVDWEWYSDVNVFRLFIHLILTANWEPKKWKGVLIKRGQKITSIQHMAQETGLTEQSVRTAIKKLKSTGELTSKSTNKYTVVTLTNYDLYQEKKKQVTSETTGELTNEEQTTNKQLTTTKQYNNITIKQKENNIPAFFDKKASDVLPFTDESKKIHTKDTITKDKIHSVEINSTVAKSEKPAAKINGWALWVDINRARKRADPIPTGADTKAVKMLVSHIKDLQTIKDVMGLFLDDDDQYLQRNGHALRLISGRVNAYINQAENLFSVPDDDEALAVIMKIEDEVAAEEQAKHEKQSGNISRPTGAN